MPSSGSVQQRKNSLWFKVVQLVTFLAVSHFNESTNSIHQVLQKVGIDPGAHCMRACKKLDYNWIWHSQGSLYSQ